MATFEYKLKCMACGLHYTVLSWVENWGELNEHGFCPECGVQGRKFVWGPDQIEEQVFERVPGGSPLRQLS